MSEVRNLYTADPKKLLYAIEAWIIASVMICSISAGVIMLTGAGEGIIGYTSSFISFASAVISGMYVKKKTSRGGIFDYICIPLFEVILILSLGYIISDGKLNSGAILSVVSFTVTGFLVGDMPAKRRGRRGRVTVRRHT